MEFLPEGFVLSLGIIDGRNIWKLDLSRLLDWLEPMAKKPQNRLWLASSYSLLHVPVDLDAETKLDLEVKHWLAFVKQKLSDLMVLGKALRRGRSCAKNELSENTEIITQRQRSKTVAVKAQKLGCLFKMGR